VYPTRSWFCKNVPGRPLQRGKDSQYIFDLSLVGSNVAIQDLAPCVCACGPVWPCAGCGDKAKDLYDTAQQEEKENNQPHATKLIGRS